MSYILDALKKSEKERQIGQVPTLNSVEEGELTPAAKPFPILLVTIIMLLLVVIALLYFKPGKVESEIPVAIDAVQMPKEEQSPVEQMTEPQDIMEVMMQEQVQQQQQQVEKEVTPAPIKTEVIPDEQFNEELLKEGEILITPTSRREAAEAKVNVNEVITLKKPVDIT